MAGKNSLSRQPSTLMKMDPFCSPKLTHPAARSNVMMRWRGVKGEARICGKANLDGLHTLVYGMLQRY